jgi:MHS family proline/betaine transporter-like MFS transporter
VKRNLKKKIPAFEKPTNENVPNLIQTSASTLKSQPTQIEKKVILSAIIGNGLEFYDFALFGAFSVAFSKIFFTGDGISPLLGTLSIFAIAFFVRPIGSIFFGYLGDTYGRKKALTYSIIFMGFFTFLIGCLPTYETAGFVAPLLLVCCRLGQGFCLGGENNGSAIFLLEHLKQRKAYAGALILTGGAVGTILATFFAGLANLPSMPEWAWRVPFLLGIFIGLLGTYIRNFLKETPEFLQAQKKKEKTSPLLHVLKAHTRPFVCAVGIGGVNGVLAYTVVVYIGVYLAKVINYPLSNSLFCSCLGLVLFGSLAPIAGHLADKMGERKVMTFSCFLTICCAPFIFYLLQQRDLAFILAAIALAATLMATFNGPTNALLQRLFPANVRYTGIAFGYATGAALMGGTQPLICTYLIETTQNSFAPAFYLMAAAGVGLTALSFSKNILGEKQTPITSLAELT